MMRVAAPLLLLAAISAASPAAGRAGSFVLVNGTDGALSDLSISRFGANQWRALAVAPPAGARGDVQFDDPDCAFDIRGEVQGAGVVTWKGVNLCEAKIVTLKRNGRSGATWVEYD